MWKGKPFFTHCPLGDKMCSEIFSIKMFQWILKWFVNRDWNDWKQLLCSTAENMSCVRNHGSVKQNNDRHPSLSTLPFWQLGWSWLEFKGRSDGQKWGNTSQNVSKSRLNLTLLYSKFMKRLVSAFCNNFFVQSFFFVVKRDVCFLFFLKKIFHFFFEVEKKTLFHLRLALSLNTSGSQHSASEAANHLSEPQKKLSPVGGREEEELSCSWAAVEIFSCFCHRKLR